MDIYNIERYGIINNQNQKKHIKILYLSLILDVAFGKKYISPCILNNGFPILKKNPNTKYYKLCYRLLKNFIEKKGENYEIM